MLRRRDEERESSLGNDSPLPVLPPQNYHTEALPPLKQYDFIEVDWIDANSPREEGWLPKDAYEEWKKEDMIVKSVGQFLESDKKFLRLSFGRAIFNGETHFLILPFAIPLVNIKKICKLQSTPSS